MSRNLFLCLFPIFALVFVAPASAQISTLDNVDLTTTPTLSLGPSVTLTTPLNLPSDVPVTFTGVPTGTDISLTGPTGVLNAATNANVTLNLAGGNFIIENGNQTTNSGSGGVFSVIGGGSKITIATSGTSLTFTNNTAAGNGGVLYVNGNVAIDLAGGALMLSKNTASGASGGGIFAGGTVTTDVAGTYTLSNNSARTTGGGIAAGSATLNGNWTVNNNIAGGSGGGIYAGSTATLNGNWTMNNNTAGVGSNGGAVCGNSTSVIVNGNMVAANNIAGSPGGGGSGGVLFSYGNITITGNSTMTNNTAQDSGGAIAAWNGNVTVNGNLTLNNNQARTTNTATSAAGGGAVLAGRDVVINGTLSADNNTATSFGGVIYTRTGNVSVSGGNITLTNNAATGNSKVGATGAGGDGGAIYSLHDITLSPTGDMLIANNQAIKNGGALWADANITINAVGNTVFSNNTAGATGGAIYMDPDMLTLNATGGNITFSGNMMNTTGTPQANAIYIDDLDATDGPAQVNLIAAAGNSITFFDPIASNATNGPITVTEDGGGMVSFDGSHFAATDYANLTSAVFANTTVNAGTFEVANNAIYGAYNGADPVSGNALSGSSFTSAAGTTVQGGGAGTIVADAMNINGNVNIAGRQPWSTAGAYSTFTLNANTVNFGGGTIYFNTMLNEGMPNNQSDLLILNHAQTTGAAFVSVANTNGLGAYTPGDGIMLVQAVNGATTQPGMFALSGPVAAGAYEYNLFQGGVSGDPTTANNWYLRDTMAPPVPPIPPTPGQPEIIFLPVAITNPLFGVMQVNNAIAANPDATIVPVPYKSVPNYRVEVPVYMAAPALADRMGLMMLGTYHERVGEDRPDDWDTETSQAVLPDGKGEPRQKSGWGRVFGMIGNVGFDKSGSNFAQNGPSFDYSMGAIQVGTDLLRGQHDNGQRDIAGLYVGMMTGHADVKKVYSGGGAGTVDMNGYSLAAYWTHKGQKEWYLDAVLQGTRYANTQAQSGRGQKIHPDGWGLAASLEAGYPVALGHGWALEPQAQMIYQWISLNNDSDQFGTVKFDDTHSWHGRVGARLTKDWTSQSGKKASVWARANLWHSFGSTAKTTFNSFNGQNPVGMKTQLGGTWGQVGLGVDGHLSQRLTAFVNGDYNFNMGSQTGHSLGGRVGLRYQF